MIIQLLPGLQRAWRGPSSLQLGVSPRRAAVLDGLTKDDVALLDRLVEGVDPVDLARGAAPAELLGLLREAGALVPARAGRSAHTLLEARHEELEPDAAVWALMHRGSGDGWNLLAARARRHVLVVGTGRVTQALADALREAGVGGVEVLTRLTERSLRARSGRALGTPPACVVLVEPVAADSARATDLVRRDVPHLSVVLREGDVVVGPLVLPGAGPCLRCLDLHRTDLDPAWPGLLAQLLAGARTVPEESLVAGLAGRLAALQVLALLDARSVPAAVGATLEEELPDGLAVRRPWTAHPACGCVWPPDEPDAGHDPGHDAAPDATDGAPAASPAHREHPGAAAGRMDG